MFNRYESHHSLNPTRKLFLLLLEVTESKGSSPSLSLQHPEQLRNCPYHVSCKPTPLPILTVMAMVPHFEQELLWRKLTPWLWNFETTSTIPGNVGRFPHGRVTTGCGKGLREFSISDSLIFNTEQGLLSSWVILTALSQVVFPCADLYSVLSSCVW